MQFLSNRLKLFPREVFRDSGEILSVDDGAYPPEDRETLAAKMPIEPDGNDRE